MATTGDTFSDTITFAYGYPVPTITTTSALPVGVTLTDNQNGTASLAGTPGPTAGGVYPITITATNGVGPPVNQALVLTVYEAPEITSVASDTVAAGVAMAPFAVTDAGYPIPTLRAWGLTGPGSKLVAGTIERDSQSQTARRGRTRSRSRRGWHRHSELRADGDALTHVVGMTGDGLLAIIDGRGRQRDRIGFQEWPVPGRRRAIVHEGVV